MQTTIPTPIQGQGGLTQMLAQSGANQSLLNDTAEIERMPGGMELLYTVAAEEMMKSQGIPKSQAKKIRLYQMGGQVVEKAQGGLAAIAEQTRQGGRGDDDVLLHLSPEEFEAIEAMWGKAETNPNTGIPEYGFLSKVWKKVKKVVKKVTKSKLFQSIAPLALSIFVPGIGTAIGSALGASGVAASMVGNAVIQGGMGAISGGTKGALRGAVSGAVTGGLGKLAGKTAGLTGRTADIVGSSLVGGAGSSLLGDDFTEGALQGGLSAALSPVREDFVSETRDALGLETAPVEGASPGGSTVGTGPMDPLPPGAGTAAATPPVTGGTNFADLALKYGLPALTLLESLQAQEYDGEPPPSLAPPGFYESLPQYSFDREQQEPLDYFTYGQVGAPQQGEQQFFTPPEYNPVDDQEPPPGFSLGGAADYWEQNQDALQVASRRGGHYIRGPGSGRSDDIDAKLSDNEYVMDAESVALLGDGSPDEGARKLDMLRSNLRKHKSKNFQQGKFSLKAKNPEDYMGQLRRRMS